MVQDDIWSYFSEGEKIALQNIGVEINIRGVRFSTAPSWRDFTLTFAYIAGLSRRFPNDPDRFGFAIGDCILEGNRYFGEKKVDTWLAEFEQVMKLRDVALNMTGGLLIHLQQVENSLRGCCAYLNIEGIEIAPSDLFSADRKKRAFTLGRMARGFQRAGAFSQEFEQRLGNFVDDRNYFIH